MSRPVGITASAIVAILGSILVLLVAMGMIAALFMGMQPPSPPNSTQSLIGGAGIFAAVGVYGIWTAIGLIRLRPWARTSILIGASFLAAICIFAFLATIAVPTPPDMSPATVQQVHRLMAIFCGIPVAIAVWWLIQFNAQSTKAAFASSIPDAAPPRPISITIIAWSSIIGGASCLFQILTGLPAFVLGVVFTGWMARVIYAFLAALSFYMGKGLLDLRERARLLAIAWFAFWFVHLGLVTLVPPLKQRLLELQIALARNQGAPVPFDISLLTNVIVACTAIAIAVAIWFLVRSRPAFS